MEEINKYNYTPLPEPIPITEQQWPEGTLPLVHTRTMTYMHENFIRECIEGILMQKTTFPVQVLIHDDASTDKTAEIVREYEAKHPQLIRAYYQKENTYSKSDKDEKRLLRKTFISWRIGKYEALCEGDDYWTDPLKLQKQAGFMENNPEYSLCYHCYKVQSGDHIREQTYPKHGKDYSADELIATPGGIVTASKFYINYITLGIKQPAGFGGDFQLNAFLGALGACKYLESVGPSVYRKHIGGVWTSKNENAKHYGVINTKYNVYRLFAELNDEYRMNICLRELCDAIEEKLFVLEPKFKSISIGKERTRLIYRWIKLDIYYKPFLVLIRRKIWNLMGKK